MRSSAPGNPGFTVFTPNLSCAPIVLLNKSQSQFETVATCSEPLFTFFSGAASGILYFCSEGSQLLALETAEEGMELLKLENYDIIISDYKLPDMDGLTFSKKVQEVRPNAIRILITAYGSDEVVSEAMRIGINNFS
jgi:hypothetical protein